MVSQSRLFAPDMFTEVKFISGIIPQDIKQEEVSDGLEL